MSRSTCIASDVFAAYSSSFDPFPAPPSRPTPKLSSSFLPSPSPSARNDLHPASGFRLGSDPSFARSGLVVALERTFRARARRPSDLLRSNSLTRTRRTRQLRTWVSLERFIFRFVTRLSLCRFTAPSQGPRRCSPLQGISKLLLQGFKLLPMVRLARGTVRPSTRGRQSGGLE